MLVQVVADQDKSFASPDNACSFDAFRLNAGWKLEFLDGVDEGYPAVYLNHQNLPDRGRGLHVDGWVILEFG